MFTWGLTIIDSISQSFRFTSNGKKRARDEEPTLLKGCDPEKVPPKPPKRRRRAHKVAPDCDQSQSLLFQLPQDTLAHVCSYLTTKGDRHSLLVSCRSFHQVCDYPEILRHQDLEGDPKNRTRSILYNAETSSEAITTLYKFAMAGNVSALYMIGMIVTYCHGDKIGVTLLRQNSDHDCHRSSYALGLILRDCDEAASTMYLKKAANADFLPACQEIMESQQVKSKFGDLLAPDLEEHFDPAGLSRLLGSCYIRGSALRHVSSSHCWNPLCGRWALKAANQGSAQAQRQAEMEMVNQALPRLPAHLEVTLLALLRMNTTPQDIRANSLVAAATAGICVEADIDDIRNRDGAARSFRVSRMKMCSQCRKAKYCSKLCQVYDWRSGRHKTECQYLEHGGLDGQT